MKRLGFHALPLVVGIGVLAAVWFLGRSANPGTLGFRLDDAWIHLTYARGLLRNGFPAYNDGIPTTGFTSPLWTMCLAVPHALFGRGGSPHQVVVAVKLLGCLLHVATIAAATDLAYRITGRRLAGCAAGCLVALAKPFALAAFSGMEVSLAALLLIVATRDLVVRRWLRAGIWLALAGLARPESAVVTIIIVALAAMAMLDGRRRLWGAESPGGRDLLGLLLPSVAAGIAVAVHHLWAGGSVLPATFYAKSDADLLELPRRVVVALRHMFTTIPPFAAGIGWLPLVGLFPRVPRPGARLEMYLPLIVGCTYLLANLYVLAPIDPKAFYHMRYVLPCAPVLLVAVAIGADAIGARLKTVYRFVPCAAIVLIAFIGMLRTAEPQSRHSHNDVRNINEVQRRIGEWLALEAEPDAWIATTDAGAVRYFSDLRVIDVMGLNTPEMLRHDDEFIRTHPVAMCVIIPAWLRPVEVDRLEVLYEASTPGYTVTSMRRMNTQLVIGAKRDAEDDRMRVAFVGVRRFQLDFLAAPRERTSQAAEQVRGAHPEAR